MSHEPPDPFTDDLRAQLDAAKAETEAARALGHRIAARAEAAEQKVKELEYWKEAATRGADLLTDILGRPTATIGGFAAVTLVEAAEERMARIRDLEAKVKELRALTEPLGLSLEMRAAKVERARIREGMAAILRYEFHETDGEFVRLADALALAEKP